MASHTIERTGKQILVTLQGDLTAAIVPDVQAALKQELEKNAEEVIFDLGKAVMLDSSGIGLLIAACNTLSRAHCRMRVINVSADILQLLQSMRLINRLQATGR